MLLLIFSIIPLIVGPFIFKKVEHKPHWKLSLDALIFVSLGGIILFHILPHIIEEGGNWSYVALLLGFLLPLTLHQHKNGHARESPIVIILAIMALLIHGILDGLALSAENYRPQHGHYLAIATILHRIPVGLSLWWLAKPRFGETGALIAILTLIGATVLGFYSSLYWFETLLDSHWSIFQALLFGSLVHIIFHRPPIPNRDIHTKTYVHLGFGVSIGLGLLFLLHQFEFPHEAHTHSGLVHQFYELALQTAPTLLFGLILAGVLKTWSSIDLLFRWMNKGGKWLHSLKGTLVGLPLNICSCGVVPLFKSFSQRGLSHFAALSFLLAAPEISIPTLFLSIKFFGGELTAVRLLAAILLALFTSQIIGRLIGGSDDQDLSILPVTPEENGFSAKVYNMLHYTFVKLADDTLPWIIIGLTLAALLSVFISPEQISYVPWYLQVPIAAVIGFPLYVCATGSTPLVAMLIAKGMSTGAAITFLLTGPATNVTTWGLIKSVYGSRLAWIFSISVTLIAIVLGYIAEYATASTSFDIPKMHHIHDHVGWKEYISLWILTGVVLMSLLRQGFAGFFSELIPQRTKTKENPTHAPSDESCCHD